MKLWIRAKKLYQTSSKKIITSYLRVFKVTGEVTNT